MRYYLKSDGLLDINLSDEGLFRSIYHDGDRSGIDKQIGYLSAVMDNPHCLFIQNKQDADDIIGKYAHSSRSSYELSGIDNFIKIFTFEKLYFVINQIEYSFSNSKYYTEAFGISESILTPLFRKNIIDKFIEDN